MKGMKSRILMKLNSIPQLTHLKQTPFLHPSSPLKSNLKDPKPMRELDEYNNIDLGENKENIRPNPEKKPIQTEPGSFSFRRPDPNSATLFDPNLLVAFQQAVTEYIRNLEKARIQEDPNDPLIEFEEKSPSGGRESIILYTTSLRGIRKTFEDCRMVKSLLENLKLVFIERDLSMHLEFREELWRVVGFRAIPPRLFIKGRYIGGADEVLRLHERGRLMPLAEGMPRNLGVGGTFCEGCGGMRFAVCLDCNGGRKVFDDEQGVNVKCLGCNENGLVVCPLCCC